MLVLHLRHLTVLALLPVFALMACNSGTEVAGSNTVEMRDMEVVDGTASDAMTDLDGVRTEGTALVPTSTTGNSAAPKAAANAAADDSAEIVATE